MLHALRARGPKASARSRSSRPAPVGGAEPTRDDLGPRDLIVAAAWFGLLAGFLELGVVVAQNELAASVTMSSLRTNVHAAWMIPSADLFLFTSCGIGLAWLSRTRRRLAQRLACAGFAMLLPLVVLLRIEGLYSIARIVLPMGFAASFGPVLDAGASRFRRLTRSTLPLFVEGLVLLAALNSYGVYTAERRALARLPEPRPDAQNVVLIVLDNVRAASMSLYGHSRRTTPNLDRLAERSIRFTNARSTAPWTLPSHASMFTGQWPHKLGMGWSKALDSTYPTLAECLGDQGYATAGFVGNVYYCNRRYGLDRGFARYEDYYENQTVSAYEVLRSSGLGQAVLARLGFTVEVGNGELYRRKTAAMLNGDLLGWLDRQPRARPFFAFVNYYDAHAPCVLPAGAETRFGHCQRPQRELIESLKRFQRSNAGASRPGDGDRARIEQEALSIFLDSYESCIAYLDQELGRLMTELAQRGLLEDTWVVVTSDHGEHFNEHGFQGHGQSVYRRELDVPLLIVPPLRAEAGVRATVDRPVSLRELPATILDVLGIEQGPQFPGRSLASLWRDSEAAEAAANTAFPVLSEVGHKVHVPYMKAIPATRGAVESVVTEGHIYIHNADGREELYELADQLERNDLAGLDLLRPQLARCREALAKLLSCKK